MAQKFWIGVAVAEHVRKGAQEGFCAFAHGKESSVAKLALGDRFVYYATKTRFENGQSVGEPVQAFLAAGTVTGPVEENHYAGYPAFTRRADYDPLFNVPVKSVMESLSFIKNPQYWGMAFRRSLFEISQDDYKVIMSAKKG